MDRTDRTGHTDRVSFHVRVAAFLVDLGLFAVAAHVAAGIDLALYRTAGTGYFGGITWAGAFAALLALFGLEALLGRSPGKWLAGLAVAADDGRRAPRGVLVRRAAFKFAPVWLLILPVITFMAADPGGPLLPDGVAEAGLFALCVVDAIVTAGVTVYIIVGCCFALEKSRQAFHDRFAGTAVYRTSELRDPMSRRGFAPVLADAPGAAGAGDALNADVPPPLPVEPVGGVRESVTPSGTHPPAP